MRGAFLLSNGTVDIPLPIVPNGRAAATVPGTNMMMSVITYIHCLMQRISVKRSLIYFSNLQVVQSVRRNAHTQM
jgi:hypothetical protein